MDSLWQDLRYGVRGLRNQPAFTVLAALALAAVIAVVMIAGIAACFFPVRRATRVDPMIALRYG